LLYYLLTKVFNYFIVKIVKLKIVLIASPIYKIIYIARFVKLFYTTMKPLAETIKQMRERADLSQNQLAQRAELSLAYISKLEDGKYASMTIKTCKALSKGFGMTIQELLEELEIIASNRQRPSFQMVSQALRNSGYSAKEIDKVVDYAKYIKEERANK